MNIEAVSQGGGYKGLTMYQTHFQCCLLYTASFSKQVWGRFSPSLQHRLNLPNVAYSFMMHKLISWHSASSVVVIFINEIIVHRGQRGKCGMN